MKIREKGIAILLTAVLVFGMTACADSGGTASPPAGASAEPAQSAQDPSSGGAVSSPLQGLKIGYAQRNTNGAWLISQTENLKEEAAKRGVELIVTDADDNQAKQISDVEDLCAQGIDYLIYPPIEYEGGAPALEIAKAAGIPVILLGNDCSKTDDHYVTLLKFDYTLDGGLAGKWLADNFSSAEIVEITGIPGSEPAMLRAQGFAEAIAANPDLKIIAYQTGNFLMDEAQQVMENIIQSYSGQFDTVFCHTDEMALGVVAALKANGLKPGTDIKVIGIDGQKAAVQAIVDGEMNCITTCDTKNGPLLFDTLEKIAAGEQVEKSIIIPSYVIDAANAETELPLAF